MPKIIDIFLKCLVAVFAISGTRSALAADIQLPTTLPGTVGLITVVGGVLGLLIWQIGEWRRTVRESQRLQSKLDERKKIEDSLKESRDKLSQDIENRTRDLEARNRQLNETRCALEAANDKLQKLVCVDGLTGISNRRHFDEVMEQEIRRSLREHKSLSLILADVDYFKAYNDTYGHLRGDEALKKVAQYINSIIKRAGDLAARYGGEEFAVVLASADQDIALRFAEQLRAGIYSLAIPHAASSIADRVTISCGIATIPPDHLYSSKEVISVADQALYNAKHRGRNRVEVLSQVKGKPSIGLVS